MGNYVTSDDGLCKASTRPAVMRLWGTSDFESLQRVLVLRCAGLWANLLTAWLELRVNALKSAVKGAATLSETRHVIRTVFTAQSHVQRRSKENSRMLSSTPTDCDTQSLDIPFSRLFLKNFLAPTRLLQYLTANCTRILVAKLIHVTYNIISVSNITIKYGS